MEKQEQVKFDMQEYINEKRKTKEYGTVEICILKALQKYLFLDRLSLADAVNQILNKRLQKPDYDRNLKKMLGITVMKQVYSESRYNGGKPALITIYYLAYPAYRYMQMQYHYIQVPFRVKKRKPADILSIYDDGYIRERLMLNRYHLNISRFHEDAIILERYCQRTAVGIWKIKVPSLFRIRKDDGKYVIVIAIPYVIRVDRRGHAVRRIVEKIREINKVGLRNISENILLVLICESYEKMAEAYQEIKMESDNLAKGLLYVMDADMAENDILSRFYSVTGEESIINRTYSKISGL